VNHWRKFPFVRLLIPFAAGIVLHELNNNALAFIAILTVFSIGTYLLVHFSNFISILKLPYIKGLCLLLFVGCLGYGTNYCFQEQHYSNYFKNQKGKYLVVRVCAMPTPKAKSIKIEAQIIGIGDSTFKKCRGNLLLYLQNKTNTTLKYGDELLILAQPIQHVSPPINPYEFDFQRYLHYNNTHNQGYLNNNQWTSINKNSSYAVFRFTIAIQHYLHRTFTTFITDNQHRGIVEALVFGYRNDLDKDIISAYSKTGIIHVLAVSGLHVGLIYSVLSFITISLNTSLFKKRIRVVIIILFLIGYALLTGLSPSVCRAVLMFSFFVFKDAIKRETNVYNVLSASAVILLNIQPLWLYNVGFQLSYLAVFSIVFIQAYVKKWLPITDWFLAKAWTLVAVSIAAQIVTFPLCLYYFHQYPNLFFISNLIIIPLIFIVLSLSAILPVFAGIKVLLPIANLLAKLISIYLEFINTVVYKIQDLPYSYFDDLYINFNEMWLIYGLVFSILLWLIYKIPKFIWPAFFCTSLLIISQSNRIKENHKTKAWVSFAIKGHSNLCYKNGSDLILFVDSALIKNTKSIDFHIKPWFLAKCGGKMQVKALNSLVKSQINLLTINQKAMYILPTNKARVLRQLPHKSNVFCLKPIYPTTAIIEKDLAIVAPTIKGNNNDNKWHSMLQNGFWFKALLRR
jgi:competence protein ComEC